MEDFRWTKNFMAVKGALLLVLCRVAVVKCQFLTSDDGQLINDLLGNPQGSINFGGPGFDVQAGVGGGQGEIDVNLDLGGQPSLPGIDLIGPSGDIDLSGIFGGGWSGDGSGSISGSESSETSSSSGSVEGSISTDSGSVEGSISTDSGSVEGSISADSGSSDDSISTDSDITVEETIIVTETESSGSSSTSDTDSSSSGSSSTTSDGGSSDSSSSDIIITTTTSGGGSSSTASRGRKKKIIKKGKRKVKRRRMWQSSFSQQSVRTGGIKRNTTSNTNGGGQKVKVVKRRLGWEQNMFTKNRTQSAGHRELLQKRWNTAGERATEPVGLKAVGVKSSRTLTQSAPSKTTSKNAAGRTGTATTTQRRPTQNKKGVITSIRFKSSAKSAVATTRQQTTAGTTKLKLGLKDPLKKGTPTVQKYQVSTKSTQKPNVARRIIPSG